MLVPLLRLLLETLQLLVRLIQPPLGVIEGGRNELLCVSICTCRGCLLALLASLVQKYRNKLRAPSLSCLLALLALLVQKYRCLLALLALLVQKYRKELRAPLLSV